MWVMPKKANKATRTEKAKALETALEAYDGLTSEQKLETGRGSISDQYHYAVREALQAAGNDPHDPEVLYARGFINHQDPESSQKASRKLIEELRA